MATLPGVPVVPDPSFAWFGMRMDQYAAERFSSILAFLRAWGWEVNVLGPNDAANNAHWRANVDIFSPLPTLHAGRSLDDYQTPLSNVALAAYIAAGWRKGQSQELMRRNGVIYYNPAQ
jgi:hypothetical protein